MKNDNTCQVSIKFLRALKVPVTTTSVVEELQRHPHYPSLLSISDLLSRCNVPNAASHISAQELKELPLPFICALQSQFAIVHAIEEKTVVVSDHERDRYKLTINEFKKAYAGTILIAEKTEESGQPDYSKKRIYERLNGLRQALIFLLPVAWIAYFLYTNPGFFNFFEIGLLPVFTVKIAGLFATIVLLIQSIDADNPLARKMCFSKGSNVNCNSIITSDAAKVFKGLSWSEVGLFYFAGTLVSLSMGFSHGNLVRLLACLNYLALPYTVYSIYYQYKIAKQWCLLCCIVQALLWIEFFAFLPSLGTGPIQWPTVNEVLILLLGTATPAFLWIYLKPIILQMKEQPYLKQQLSSFKYNAELFNSALKLQPRVTQPDKNWSLLLGSGEDKNVITIVTNPYCEPCAKAHKYLHELLSERSDLQARIVFNTTVTGNDRITKVSRHLMALSETKNQQTTRQALDEWYGQKQKNYETWASLHGVTISDESAHNYHLQQQREWCDYIGLTATPTVFLNGYRLPDLYQIQDLKYLLDEQA